MLIPGSTYTWQVRGYNAAGNGPWSTLMSFAPVSTGGFNSQFNGSSAGWGAVSGSWFYNSSRIMTSGSDHYSNSAGYTTAYANFDYSASFQRIGCSWCDNYLYVRGTPPPISSYGFWNDGYQFTYANDGTFSVWLIVGGQGYLLQDYTYSPAIIPGGWNTLRVLTSGNQLYFYINGALVWTGLDPYFTSGGVVGLAMDNFEDSVTPGDKLLVDWAILNSYTNEYRLEITDTVSPEQQSLNDAANADQTDNLWRKPFMILP